jgi:peptidoglycan/xylan/chitin deacetylase (PgdA/CDA1 family)
MIGVIADSSEHNVVQEWFELFKTPWEYWRRGGRYEVVLSVGDNQFDEAAKLVIVYAGKKVRLDNEQKLSIRPQHGHTPNLLYKENRIPIYGDLVTFPEKGRGLLADQDSHRCAAYIDCHGERVLARIGYDLLAELRALLTVGQPASNASIPTLDWHIAILRDLIAGCGVRLVEIPPVPDGYRFIACLTHDVDHPSIAQHGWDHTTVGFLYRALFGSLRNLALGRMSMKDVFANWAAVLRLPFVHLGVAKDFWRDFDRRYFELEKGVHSTFFVIPFSNDSGQKLNGRASKIRAARYGARDIVDTMRKLLAAGSEIGLHGIDAWLDSDKGHEEVQEIRRLTGLSEIGVRMHWLYYDHRSPVSLEKAGASYDSTIGYNETIGYRAGTTQAYKPLEATRLLELPLHVMDTALFFPGYLGLSPDEAKMFLSRMIDNSVRFGGCLTINWHDRSAAPERLWGRFYGDLVKELKTRGAWCSTAGQAISWFRRRRAIVFENGFSEPANLLARLTADSDDDLPRLQLRIHEG